MIIIDRAGATYIAVPSEPVAWDGNLPGPGVLWILKCAQKPLFPEEIAERCDRSIEHVERELARLKRRDDVAHTRNGRWFSIAE